DDATDLLVAADHGVELALARDLGEVHAILLERLVGALGVGARDARRAAHGRQRGRERVTRGPRGPQSLGGGVRAGRDAEQEVLGRDVLVAERLGLLARGVEDRTRRARGTRLARGARARRARAGPGRPCPPRPRRAGRRRPRLPGRAAPRAGAKARAEGSRRRRRSRSPRRWPPGP